MATLNSGARRGGRFYPTHEVKTPDGKEVPVAPAKLNTHLRYIMDNVYDVQSAIQQMTGGGTALAQISNGSVANVVIMFPGFGYASAPKVTISGDGNGAKATATVSNGRLTGIQVTAPGSGYTFASVSFDS